MPTAVLRARSARAEDIVSALGPEVRHNLPKTKLTISLEEGAAVLRIEANDTTSMRAAVNSFLECIAVAEDIDKITKGIK